MTKPAVILLDDHPDSLTVLEAALCRRYGQDYLIVSEASAAAALRRHLADLRDAGRPVALIMAAASMRTANSPDVLAEARNIQPAAKRVLVVPRWRRGCAQPARSGAAGG